MKRTGIFIDSIFKEHDPGFDQIECPARIITLQSSADSLCNNEFFVQPEIKKAFHDILRLNHTDAHINAIKATSGKMYSVLDEDTFTSPRSYDAACFAAGAVTQGIELLHSGEIANGFALVRPPGHHAENDRSMGYCLFNNVAIAARYARENFGYKKIIIVDFDVHHGNGTQNAFYKTDEVLFISIHQSSCYPGTGSINEVGSGKGEGYTVNIPFPGGQGDAEYANAFNTVVRPIAYQYQPEMILVSAGFDGAMEDSISTMYLTYQGYGYMAYLLKKIADEICGGKILFTLEGGYQLDALKQGVFAVLSELADQQLQTPFASKLKEEIKEKLLATTAPHPAIEMVRDIAKTYWKM